MDEDKKPLGKRYRKMDTIAHVFSESELNQKLFGAEGFQFFLLQKKWEKIVGPIMAKESYISSYKGNTLFVTVTNSVYMQQLFMTQMELLERLHQDPFGNRFTEIRFVAGPRKKKYRATTTLDGVNRQIEKEQVMYNQTLTEGETEWIQKWVKGHIANDKLQGPFSHMMEEVLKIRKGELANGFHPCPLCGSLCPAEKKICHACESQLKKKNQNQVTLLLKAKSHLTYQEVQSLFPCSYEMYQKARDILIHRYKENIFHKFATEEEKRKLLSLLLHKPIEEISREEAARVLRRMPQKKW